jgi:hypothetical protein
VKTRRFEIDGVCPFCATSIILCPCVVKKQGPRIVVEQRKKEK